MVRHLPFIEALAHAPPEDWDMLKVGYLVLRVFDDWIRSGPAAMMSDARFEMIYADIEQLPSRNAAHGRACRAILDAFLSAPGREPTVVAGPLMGYAALLGVEKRWVLAADIYETVSNAFIETQPMRASEREMLANALFLQAEALRNAGQSDDAVNVYRRAAQAGKDTPVPATRLQAYIGLATIARERGNLARAEQILSAVLRTAEYLGPKVTAAYADALHARGLVRHARGTNREAIRDLFMAYQLMEDLGVRELILTDLGVCAGAAGFRATAEDALSLVANRGYNTLARSIALVNLIELAVLDDNRAAFDQRRLEWEQYRTGSDPNTQGYANLYIARGIARFIKGSIARQVYQDAMVYAKANGLKQIESLASMELDAVVRSEVPLGEVPPARPLSDDLADVGRMLSDMRDRALAGV